MSSGRRVIVRREDLLDVLRILLCVLLLYLWLAYLSIRGSRTRGEVDYEWCPDDPRY